MDQKPTKEIETYCEHLWRQVAAPGRSMPLGFRLGVMACLKDQEQQDTPNIRLAASCDPAQVESRLQSIKSALINQFLPVLTVETSSICNLACKFCGAHSPDVPWVKSGGVMSLELFQEVIDKCQGLPPFNVLYLHGNGEPLLNSKLVEMVQIASAAQIAKEIVLVTNGLLLTDSLFQDLFYAGVGSFRISLDAITPVLYKAIKGISGATYALRNIEGCLDIMRRAEGIRPNFAILCADPATSGPVYAGESWKIVKHFTPLLRGLSNTCIQYRRLFPWVESINRLTRDDGYQRQVPCEQPFYLLMIHTDGDVSACCADTAKNLVVGNIQKAASLREIVLGESLRQTRLDLLSGDFRSLPLCEKCQVYSAVDEALHERADELRV